jgi:FkbM family methyltransferase
MHVSWRKRVSRTVRGKLCSLPLSTHGVGVAVATKNGLLVVDPRDFGVSRSLLSRGSYDWPAIAWLSSLLDRQSRIVVVGAHLGAVLIPLALRSGSRNIIALEPSPSTYRLLEMNLALNGLTDVTVHRMAVGDCSRSIRFTQNPLNSGNSRVSPRGEIIVPMTTLDSLLETDPAPIDLLVMDTEGFETHVMRGAVETLARTRFLYVEYAPEQLMEQGSSPQEFLDLVSRHFDSMYLPGTPPTFFPSRTYMRYLSELPTRRGLLLNLLFSRDARCHEVLLTSSQ